jgi:flagellar biosynthesis/type III secretory pathway protein FliH
MFDVKDKRILKYIQDYRINLIEPAAIPDEDFAKFRTELCQVFKYIKYSADKKKLPEMMDEDVSYRNISRKTANMINTVTNSNIKIDNGKETVDMCEAIKGIREDGRNEGLIEGRNEGLIQGRSEGLIEGRNEGLIQGKINANTETAKKAIELGKLSFEEIAAICNLTLKEIQEIAENM